MQSIPLTPMAGHGRFTRRRALTGLGLGAVGSLALAACSPPENDGNAGSSDGGSGSGNGNGAVTILTHDAFSLPEDLLSAFQEKSGFELTTVSAGDAGVANQLVLNPSQYDGVYGIDSFTAGIVQEKGAVTDYTSSALPASAKQYALEGLTPIDMGDVCINVDPAWFEENGVEAPTALEQLADPTYAKLTVLITPDGTSTGFAFLAGLHTALDDPDAFIQAMLDGGAKVAAGWSEAYYEDFTINEGGQFPLALSYASSPAETEGATSIIEDSSVRQIEYAGVVEGAANPEGAQAFIDWMLSPEVQAEIPGSMYMYPVDDQVGLPEVWSQFATLVKDPILPDATEVHEQRDAWIDAWNAAAEG